MKLGEKIKSERRRQKMTQSELSGDKITRNMLSQIENGKASPSLDTLIYIADRLEIPVAYLVDETLEENDFKSLIIYKKITEKYKSGKFSDCIKLYENNRLNSSDELSLVMAEAYFQKGKESLHNGRLSLALDAFAKSSEFCKKTPYRTEHLETEMTLLSAISSNIQAPRLVLDENEYVRLYNKISNAELFHYVINDTSYRYTDPVVISLINAKKAMNSKDFETASEILTGLDLNKGKLNIGFFFLFRIFSDLETCFKEMKDFESAYKYSSKRISLLSSLKMS